MKIYVYGLCAGAGYSKICSTCAQLAHYKYNRRTKNPVVTGVDEHHIVVYELRRNINN